MNVKKWHIYIIALLCFVMCFIVLNKKYDPFYRVNGINNDNRALIEQYLDANQQQYLIDNAIAVDYFIQYIDIPGFNLENYEYYNMLNKAKIFKSKEELIASANTLVSRLEVSFGQSSLLRCEELVSNNLVLAYMNQTSFDFQNINYYQIVRILYDTNDYQYITDTNTYVVKLQNDGIITTEDKNMVLKTLTSSYDKDSLLLLLTTPLQEGTTTVLDPQDKSIVVDQNHFIGSYEPKHIVSIRGISSVTYSMYLDEDAYIHLKDMYDDLVSACGKGLIVRKSYRSYSVLLNQENANVLEIAGYSEYQLGTTVEFQQNNYSIEDFKGTTSYQWLVENAYQYGFILRYPEGKTKEFRSNIFRYVGKELAKTLHDNNWTLEEYATQKEQNENQQETP